MDSLVLELLLDFNVHIQSVQRLTLSLELLLHLFENFFSQKLVQSGQLKVIHGIVERRENVDSHVLQLLLLFFVHLQRLPLSLFLLLQL